MPNTSAISVDQLLRYPFIADRISRIASPGAAISQYFGANLMAQGEGDQASITSGAGKRSDRRDIVYDIFDNTRTINSIKAEGTGASTVSPKPIGQVSGKGVRTFLKLPFYYEKLRDYRPLGNSNPTVVDNLGAQYIADQTTRLIQKQLNLRELMFVQMLKGSTQLKKFGEDWLPVPSGGTRTIDYQLPASHKAQLALDDGGADIFTESLASTTADIITPFHKILALGPKLSGFTMTDVWMNSSMFAKFKQNEKLQAAGGTAFKVFDRYGEQSIEAPSFSQSLSLPSKIRTYQVRALPEFNFHVYDGGLTYSADGAVDDNITGANFVKHIGDDELIITPSPDQREWFDVWDVMEYVAERYNDTPKPVYGFHTYARQEVDPVPATALYLIDNFMYGLTIPSAIFNPTVIFS